MYRFVLLMLTLCFVLAACGEDDNPVGPDTTPPVISEVTPLDGSSVIYSVLIEVTATDDEGVTRVEFYIDGLLHFADTTVPWSFAWIVGSTEDSTNHNVYCVAYDAAGNSVKSDIQSILVVNNIVLPPPPTLSGQYYGWYSRAYLGVFGSSREQRILWTFTEQWWDMDVDTDNMTDFQICESYGRYTLTNCILFTVDGSQPLGDSPMGNWTSCDDRFDPTGLFVLDQSTDTLRMAQLLTDAAVGTSILVQIKLLPIAAP